MKHSILTTLAALAVLAFTTLPLSAAEVVTYYHNDHLGSPIAATDDTGTVVWQQAYDAWGLKLTANTDERGYTGNWLDEETGLADHKARWYTSSIGRFTGIDPVEWHETNIHSFNRYAYGNNNPYSYSDQNGELAFPVVPILGVMALEALGVGLEVATMEETSDSINRSGAGAFGVTGMKLGRSASTLARGSNASSGSTGRFAEIATGISRGDARSLLRSGTTGLPDAQARSILKQFRKQGRVDSVSIKVVNRNGNVRVGMERTGAESGFQRFTFEFAPDGRKLRSVQTAFDDAGNLVRQSPGNRKNNLYDVKK